MVLESYKSLNAELYNLSKRSQRFKNSLKIAGLNRLANTPPIAVIISPDDTPYIAPLADSTKQRYVVQFLCELSGEQCHVSQNGKTIRNVGTVLASGVNGTSIKLFEKPNALYKYVLQNAHNLVQGSRSQYSSEIYVIKVQYSASYEDEVLKVREDLTHKYVAESTVTSRGATAPGDSFVPEFIVGGTLMSRSGLRFRVTLMSLVDGQPLWNLMKSGNLSPELYVRLEHAVMLLWSVGISHSDLHANNVLVNRMGQPIIIDLGFAVTMPSALRDNLVAELDVLPVTADIWETYNKWYLPAASLILISRGFDQNNPDSVLLRQLSAMFSPKTLATARVDYYGSLSSRLPSLNSSANYSLPSLSSSANSMDLNSLNQQSVNNFMNLG